MPALTPQYFHGVTTLLGAPPGWDPTLGPCEPLPAKIDDGFVTTMWKPSVEEIVQLQGGGVIVLRVVGATHPPMCLEVAMEKTVDA